MWNPPRSALLAGRFAAAERLGETLALPPPTTAHGALLGHITGGHVETDRRRPALVPADERQFRPVPAARRTCRHKGPDGKRLRGPAKTVAKKRALSQRALADLDRWIAGDLLQAAE